MKLLQAGHNPEVRIVEMELSQLEESETAPERPSKLITKIYCKYSLYV
jgi:hypothetical protein